MRMRVYNNERAATRKLLRKVVSLLSCCHQRGPGTRVVFLEQTTHLLQANDSFALGKRIVYELNMSHLLTEVPFQNRLFNLWYDKLNNLF